MCVIGAIFTLLVALSELIAPSNFIADLLLHSPIFGVSLFIVLWFVSPIFVSATKINTGENLRAYSLIILGIGFLLIFIAILVTWFMK